MHGAGFSAQQQEYLIGRASDESRCLDADLGAINGNGTKIRLWDHMAGGSKPVKSTGTGW